MAWVKDIEGYWVNTSDISAMGVSGPTNSLYQIVAVLKSGRPIVLKVYMADTKAQVQHRLDSLLIQLQDILIP